jgi:hypothetical protein
MTPADRPSRPDDDHVKLLSGPYKPPRVQVGERVECLFRDADVVVYGWSEALIPWPLCCRRTGRRVGGKGLLVDEELARAVRRESAAAVQHWWGVSRSTVLKWRKALGADRNNNPGTRRLVRAAVEEAASAQRGATPSAEQVERRRQAYAERNARGKGPLYAGALWTEEELALLGTAPDAQVAALLGRTAGGVENNPSASRGRPSPLRPADERAPLRAGSRFWTTFSPSSPIHQNDR